MYKLVTFNDDYADEHNIPALNCFSEEEYDIWLNTPMGVVNENYATEMPAYEDNYNKYLAFGKELYARNLHTKPINQFSASEKKWYDSAKVDYPSSRNRPTKLKYCFLTANLGNGGDGFEDSYKSYLNFQDMIDNNRIKVYDVSKSFYDTFHKTKLDHLSLCNIFDVEALQECEWDSRDEE